MKRINSILVFVITSLILAGLDGYVGSEEEPFIYDSKGKRDPFIPLIGKGAEFLFTEVAVGSMEGIYLEGVVWDPVDGSLAIINGEIAAEGDIVGGFKVKEIKKEEVVLVKEGEEFIITLIEEVEEDVK